MWGRWGAYEGRSALGETLLALRLVMGGGFAMIVRIEEMGSSGGALINTCLNLRICRITVFAYPTTPLR